MILHYPVWEIFPEHPVLARIAHVASQVDLSGLVGMDRSVKASAKSTRRSIWCGESTTGMVQSKNNRYRLQLRKGDYFRSLLVLVLLSWPKASPGLRAYPRSDRQPLKPVPGFSLDRNVA
ncbi:hypothetical protein N7468_008856 [Penicillium chermesinum]|uniref:Uncharacterized protein n=1 Tax=Penicillium chermesinum TaxID=63820 RepID=A0A9W9NGT5_9EURO|nr:uncharacterized protein N7468_008856 [Penicillium chermesinum]KAJ5219652.1 hypothetical protein N7468_008856 [Penicillium chermesinum]